VLGLLACAVLVPRGHGAAQGAQHERAAERSAKPPVVEVLVPSETPEAAHDRARAHVKIVMYSASWCGICIRARRYFLAHHLAFEEHDIERDAAARAHHRTIDPSGSVPTIEIDHQLLVGFSVRSFEQALEAAVQERLARHESSGPKTFEVHWKK
jgi:glutaredoxin